MLLVTGLILALGTAEAGTDNKPAEVTTTPAQVAAQVHQARSNTPGINFFRRAQERQMMRLYGAQNITPISALPITGNPILDRLQVGDIDPDPRTSGANP